MAFYNALNNPSNFLIPSSERPKDQFGIFAKGYFHAAAQLAESLLSAENGFRSYDAFPVVFLYRHTLELHLKNVIYKSALLSHYKGLKDFGSKLKNTHDLAHLSNGAAEILRRLFPKDSGLETLTKTLRSIAADFQELDPKADAFRYPIATDATPSPAMNQIVNLESFHDAMSQLISGLEIVNFGFDIEITLGDDLFDSIFETI